MNESSDSARPEGKPRRKQQRRSVLTQQKLLDAAIQAFSESGFRGTSTRDIAERAGVHHPLITYHFRNKDQLWREAVNRVFRDFNVALVKALAAKEGESSRELAATFIRSYVHFAHAQPALHKIILNESSSESERLDWMIETHLRPLYEQVEHHLQSLQADGLAPGRNPALLFQMIRGCAGGLLALSLEIRATSGIDFDAPGALDELADMIIDVFLPSKPPQ